MSEHLQEIFDKVRDHLLKQNAKSIQYMNGSGACSYRGWVGVTGKAAKCAAGVLIPDDLYHPEFEGKNIYELLDFAPDLADALGWTDERVAGLVSDLQAVHDNSAVEAWPYSLAKTAAKHGLYCPEPT